jgi:hypothetical protein
MGLCGVGQLYKVEAAVLMRAQAYQISVLRRCDLRGESERDEGLGESVGYRCWLD